MADIVNVGFRVDTSQIDKGYKRLDKLGNSADKAESKVSKMTKGAKTAGVAVAGMATAAAAATAAVIAMMNGLANVERELQASARMAGLTTDQFEAMGFAYRQFGLTVEQVNDIYKDSRERIGEWLNSQSGALQDFGDAMGMSKDEITEFAKKVQGLNGQQLLQRMVNDLDAAGVSGLQLSGVMEAMASEATRMIPALENNGQAVSDLSNEYVKFNAAFSLNDEDVQNYADLAKNFDLFLDTAQNGITKTLSPLAEVMSVLAMEAADFVASLASGSIAAAQRDYSDALSEQLEARRLLGKAQNIPAAFGQDVIDQETKIAQARLDAANTAVEAADKQLEAAKKTAQAQLEVNRTTTRNVNVTLGIDTASNKETEEKAAEKRAKAIEKQAEAYDRWAMSVRDAVEPAMLLKQEIDDIWLAMLSGDIDEDIGTKRIEQLRTQIQELDINPFESMTSGAQDALSAMSGMFESGSKDAQKLAIAMQALNLVQAVGAVLNQGKGDPYTAFGRMAAMAAMVASLGVSIGNLGGDFQDESQQNQASQGLNVWGEKSESILEATEITAGATEKLVGINTNMLKAMQGLTVALSSAAGMIVRDTTIPTASVSVRENLFEGLQDFFSGDILNLTGLLGETFTNLLNLPLNIIGNWLGGSSSVTDEGIRILGGTFNELMDDVTVQAFQSVKYKKWKYGSSKSKTVFQDAGDEVGQQFALVFESIANSVAVGAEALGLSANEIEKRINEFEVATTTISLRGLSAEDQKKEIEAVFSQIFSDLAGEVVPFAKDFQQVGEDLGTTLARLASQVAVTEEITARFGINFGDKFADPEAYASAADNLATLVGGVEELAEKTSSFTNAFATDAQLFDIYQRAMNEALNEVGLTLPSTSEGLYDLMMSLDGTTEAGREQIATLLGLTDTASEYFKLLDKTAGAYRKAAEGLFEITEASRAMSLESALAAARLGDFSLAEQLDLGSIAPSTSDFNTALEYNLARAETAARLNELADLQSGQISVEDKQLTVLEEIRDKLGDSDTMNDEVKKELMELRIQMSKQQTESNDYLRRLAYQGAE
jgi:hypothetical protein